MARARRITGLTLGLGLAIGIAMLAQAGTTGRASVIDGDTIEIRGKRIRLHGIDAPEGRQTCEADGETWRCGHTVAFDPGLIPPRPPLPQARAWIG